MAETPREPTAEDFHKAIALLRRTLKRIDTVEKRLASAEERLHWLDDLPESVQNLENLTRRVSSGSLDKERVRAIARDAVEKQSGTDKDQVRNIARAAVDKRLKERGL